LTVFREKYFSGFLIYRGFSMSFNYDGGNMGKNTPKVEIKKAKNLFINILAFPLCGADVVISL
jgi:hypothetical protein